MNIFAVLDSDNEDGPQVKSAAKKKEAAAPAPAPAKGGAAAPAKGGNAKPAGAKGQSNNKQSADRAKVTTGDAEAVPHKDDNRGGRPGRGGKEDRKRGGRGGAGDGERQRRPPKREFERHSGTGM